jgi:hypothetical protein
MEDCIVVIIIHGIVIHHHHHRRRRRTCTRPDGTITIIDKVELNTIFCLLVAGCVVLFFTTKAFRRLNGLVVKNSTTGWLVD